MYINVKKGFISFIISTVLGSIGFLFTGSYFSISCSIVLWLILYCYIINEEWLNPYIILLPLLIFPMFYNPEVAPELLVPLGFHAKVVFFTSVLTLFIGIKLGEKLKMSSEKYLVSKKTIFLLSFIGFVPLVNQLVFGLPSILKGNFQEVQYLSSVPLFSSFVNFKYLGLLSLVKKKKWKIVIAYEIILLISVLGQVTKSGILFFIIFNIATFYYYRDPSKKVKKKFIIIIIIMFIMFLYYFNYHTITRNDFNIISSLYSQGRINQNFPQFFSMIYLYMESPLSNLSINIEDIIINSNYSLGYWVLNPIILLFKSSTEVLNSSFNFKTISFLNTIQFSFYSFKDFGIYGSIFIVLFIGIVFTFLNKKKNNSVLYMLTYIVWLVAGIELFFSNHFFTQTYPMICLVLTVSYHYVVKNLKRGSS